MQELTDEQRALAAAHGVATEYVDWLGRMVAAPPDTVRAVLAAMGVDASEPAAQNRALPVCKVCKQGELIELPFQGPAGAVDAWVELEDGGQVTLTVADAVIEVPADLPLGYHTVRARGGTTDAAGALVVTPAFLGLPDRIDDRRAWGFATQLYSVRSQQSWGVGDLTDLRDLAVWSGAELGADYILINPISAAEPVAPMEPSPYLPSSRRFVNPLYLRVEDIPEYDDLPPEDRAAVEVLRDDVHEKLDDLDAIERDTSWTAKATALTLIHRVQRGDARESAYQEFLRREGGALRDFATWCALAAQYGADWHRWPPELRHPDLLPVKAFREAHAELVDFYSWLQWLLDEQLAATQTAALGAGMAFGVMHDLAVGVHPRGADAWTMQDALALGINVGAPPDAFNQIGQDWSQPPWRPDRLEALAYAPYRDLIARLLRHAGAVRIDHIIGLFRLWWVPVGSTADRGTYVRYDHEAMIGILALEAYRAGAVVVGEDLGNVEPAARRYLEERGILGTSLLWFELDDLKHPLPASRWREYSLASVTTHDLPPTAGFLSGDHVVLRESLGLLTRALAEERAADEADRSAWLDLLRSEGWLAEDADTEETVKALYAFLASTPAKLVCVALTDAVGDRRTQNQPGTSNEYPNWRVPLCGPDGRLMWLSDVLASKRAAELATMVASTVRPM